MKGKVFKIYGVVGLVLIILWLQSVLFGCEPAIMQSGSCNLDLTFIEPFYTIIATIGGLFFVMGIFFIALVEDGLGFTALLYLPFVLMALAFLVSLYIVLKDVVIYTTHRWLQHSIFLTFFTTSVVGSWYGIYKANRHPYYWDVVDKGLETSFITFAQNQITLSIVLLILLALVLYYFCYKLIRYQTSESSYFSNSLRS